LEQETFVIFTKLTTQHKKHLFHFIFTSLMKKLTLAIALFAFVGSASVNAAVIKHEGEKTEKAEKTEKKDKKAKKEKSCTPGAEGTKSCCKKKGEAKA
jgi:hypothetical protein